MWPLSVRAQQAERTRRVAVVFPRSSNDAEARARFAAFREALQQLGWDDGRNVRIDTRWSGAKADDIRKDISDALALAPDVILATGSTIVDSLLQATRTVPIVFASVADPVGSGFVDTLARPGGNATGFSLFEYGVTAKWPELLKEIAPNVMRAAVLRDSAPASIGQFAVIQYVAPSIGIQVSSATAHDPVEIERAITSLSREPNGGLIVAASTVSITHRDLIVALANRHKVSSVYWQRLYAARGGLASYGPDLLDQYRRSAGYIDRILKGEKPSELPVQAPTKYELVINLKTAKALGLTVPPTLLARADEVIE
jgi:putative ABC transport system substrate-binding protein